MRSACLLLCLLLAACTAAPPPAPDPGPLFDAQGQQPLTCMAHQPQPPGPRYTEPTQRRTDETLPLLRYYTAHAAKPYCDGNGPTDTDRAWARLYVELGADKTKVAPLLS
ncbi:hypothetical protein [Kibdelosporangium phytohabitans]|uniref:hypothetical protein n=1 Tax=Kibdelosporangium phytohabitans TaxID=860235 RepID=UPI0009F99645|nr:hypothetical protein [Kibdelosporangium phytohabitans]MBE1467391.1 hypothetical protein [Kibdelosporangium phytohabitans]